MFIDIQKYLGYNKLKFTMDPIKNYDIQRNRKISPVRESKLIN